MKGTALSSARFSLPFSQSHNAMVNGAQAPRQPAATNQAKRPGKADTNTHTLLTTAPLPHPQIGSTEPKKAGMKAAGDGGEAEDDDDDEEEDDDEEDDDDEDEESGEDESDDGSSDRFSIKSDLAQISEESSKARRTPLLYIRPHLRVKFAFDQLIQVLPRSPSDTNQPATVELVSANVSIMRFSIPIVRHSARSFSSV